MPPRLPPPDVDEHGLTGGDAMPNRPDLDLLEQLARRYADAEFDDIMPSTSVYLKGDVLLRAQSVAAANDVAHLLRLLPALLAYARAMEARVDELEQEVDLHKGAHELSLNNVKRCIASLEEAFGPLADSLPDAVEMVTEEYTRRCEIGSDYMSAYNTLRGLLEAVDDEARRSLSTLGGFTALSEALQAIRNWRDQEVPF